MLSKDACNNFKSGVLTFCLILLFENIDFGVLCSITSMDPLVMLVAVQLVKKPVSFVETVVSEPQLVLLDLVQIVVAEVEFLV